LPQKLHAAQSRVLNVLGSFKAIQPDVLQETGCHAYEIQIDRLDIDRAMQSKVPFSILMSEKWQSLQDLEANMHSPHMHAHRQAIEGLHPDVKVRILERIV
jgi:quinol monooxygenase YgiN